MDWNILWLIFAVLFSVCSFAPLLDSQHWFVKFFDYTRLQLLAILIGMFTVFFFFEDKESYQNMVGLIFLLIAILHNLSILYPYFPRFKNRITTSSKEISLLSFNVQQDNREYDRVIELIRRQNPDLILTMETDKEWQNALIEIEDVYTYSVKVPLSNRYGMHFYSKLPILKHQEHFLISREAPSIEVLLRDQDNNVFVFWGIHPPPPSPTEKPSSKQKDGELMMLAKLICEIKQPVIVAGDFNNVCWSPISKLFVEITSLRDARIGKGFKSTFPASLPLLRFPIDLLFHSQTVLIHQLKVLSSIGSDHLPLFSKFSIIPFTTESNTHISKSNKIEMKEKIMQGKKAAKVENE
jgi:endonuclease/exonuclease/phosphatase (EEP) superfamily protein YafD